MGGLNFDLMKCDHCWGHFCLDCGKEHTRKVEKEKKR